MNFKILKKFRTCDEILTHFKRKGINIAKEQLNNLKKQYGRNNLDVENKLNMQQLSNVSGGIRYKVHIVLNSSASGSVEKHNIQSIQTIRTSQLQVEGITIHQDGHNISDLTPQQMANMLNETEKLILPDGGTLSPQSAKLFITNVLTLKEGICITAINPQVKLEELKSKLFLGEPSQTAIDANAEKKPLSPTSGCVHSTTGNPSNASACAASFSAGDSQLVKGRNRSYTVNVTHGQEKEFLALVTRQGVPTTSSVPPTHTTGKGEKTVNKDLLSPRHVRNNAQINLTLPPGTSIPMEAFKGAGCTVGEAVNLRIRQDLPQDQSKLVMKRTQSARYLSTPKTTSSSQNSSPLSNNTQSSSKLLHRSDSDPALPISNTYSGHKYTVCTSSGTNKIPDEIINMASLLPPNQVSTDTSGVINYMSQERHTIFQITPEAGFYNTDEVAMASWIRDLTIPTGCTKIDVGYERTINLMRDTTTKEIYAFEYEEPNERTIVFCRVFTEKEKLAMEERLKANELLAQLGEQGQIFILNPELTQASSEKAVSKLITKTDQQMRRMVTISKLSEQYKKFLKEILSAEDIGPINLQQVSTPFIFNADPTIKKFDINPSVLFDLLITKTNINGRNIFEFSKDLIDKTGYFLTAEVKRAMRGLTVNFNYSFINSDITKTDFTKTIRFEIGPPIDGDTNKFNVSYTITTSQSSRTKKDEPKIEKGSFLYWWDVPLPATEDLPATKAVPTASTRHSDSEEL